MRRQLFIPGILVFAAALAVLACGQAEATIMSWQAPAVKQLTATPSKAAVVGKQVSIECVVGSAGEMKLDTNSPQGKYLASGRIPSWTLPVEIRVNGKMIVKFDDAGLSSATATWKHTGTWTPSMSDSGKPAVIECVVDPVKKLFYSSKTLSIPVIEKEIPNVRMKDQKTAPMKAVPPSSIPVPPTR